MSLIFKSESMEVFRVVVEKEFPNLQEYFEANLHFDGPKKWLLCGNIKKGCFEELKISFVTIVYSWVYMTNVS